MNLSLARTELDGSGETCNSKIGSKFCPDLFSPYCSYRVVEDCTFGKYCGAANLMNIGGPISEFQLVESVVDENLKAGFGSVENLYQPASLLEYYSYHMPDAASLPPAYIKIPFQFRNDDDDDFCDNFSPPWALQYNYHPAPDNDGWAKRTNISPQKSLHSSDDDDQSSGEVDSPLNGRVPGSNPLGDATLRIGNSRESSQADERPLKRRRGNIFVADTADDDEEEEEVCYTLTRQTPTKCFQIHNYFIYRRRRRAMMVRRCSRRRAMTVRLKI